ncbi:MAG: hypothetical protein QM813_10555 [Verrucomicrobiota bacterium]
MLTTHLITAKGTIQGAGTCLTVGGRPGWFARWLTALRTAWDLLVPYGYEDETGFHYGVPPARPVA